MAKVAEGKNLGASVASDTANSAQTVGKRVFGVTIGGLGIPAGGLKSAGH